MSCMYTFIYIYIYFKKTLISALSRPGKPRAPSLSAGKHRVSTARTEADAKVGGGVLILRHR